MLGLGLGLYAKQSKALPALALRPPGALPEDDFPVSYTHLTLPTSDLV